MRGESVVLINREAVGTDPFGVTIYEEHPEIVEDVLIGQPSADDIVSSVQIYGKVARYSLGIPKGDTHIWEDREVEFYGHRFKTFGYLVEGDPLKIPLRWKGYIQVERYG